MFIGSKGFVAYSRNLSRLYAPVKTSAYLRQAPGRRGRYSLIAPPCEFVNAGQMRRRNEG